MHFQELIQLKFNQLGKATWLKIFMTSGSDTIGALEQLLIYNETSEQQIAVLASFVCAAYCPKGIEINSMRYDWCSLYSLYMAAIFKSKMVSAITSKLCFDVTIIFLGHNNEGIPAQTIYLPCSVWEKLTNLHSGWQPYWITRWPPPKLLVSPSISLQPKTLA